VSEDAQREGRTIAAFGIDPVAMETVVPSYLWRYRKTGQYQSDRTTSLV
jgi:NADH dehydrogenase